MSTEIVTKIVEESTAKPKTKKKVSAKKTVAKKKTTAKKTKSDLIIDTAHGIENLKKSEAYDRARELSEDIEFSYFQLGGILSVIQSNAWFTEDGFETFRDFVESEFGINYRKSMYLISIYNGLVQSGIPWTKVAPLGWTKVKELVGVITPENVDEWVAKAKGMTVLQLQQAIKEAAQTPGVDAPEGSESKVESVTTFTIKMHEDQKEVILEALERAKKEANTEHNAVALEAICMSYLSGGGGTVVQKTMPELMTQFGWQETLETFSEVFDDEDIEITVVVPEKATADA